VRERTRVDLRGLVAVVTGGGQNIGQEISRALVRSGASVVIVDRNPVTCISSAAELQVGGVTDCGVNLCAVLLRRNPSTAAAHLDLAPCDLREFSWSAAVPPVASASTLACNCMCALCC
jgi:NAD(P)-dependent dehydrogenase (short-subunit alcohol dehydrogenase family)